METQAEIMSNFILSVKETERRLEEGQDDYSMDFLRIRVDSDDLRELDEFKSVVGARSENFRKNRYRDILPFDYSRVTIDTKPARTDSGDYVNASFINGASGKVAYIATQGPLKETLADFWQMVYQYEVNVIVMLCDLIESGKPKCEKYWPDSGSKFKYGDLRVSMVSEVRERDHYVIRTLRLKRKNSSEKERMIFQFHYFGWPDHGTPDEIAPLLDFVNRLRDYQPENQYSPLVVHCSAGCGRTGTICALDYVRTLIRTKRVPADFSVYNLVSELRKQRPAMVQSKEQYVLLHRAISCMFEQELAQTCPQALQVNVSELFISSPPLTPAPPVPVDNSSTSPRQQGSLPAPLVSLSPTPSSETSGTSVSDESSASGPNSNSDDGTSPNLLNGRNATAKVKMDPHVTSMAVQNAGSITEGGDNSSITSYETVSTTKTDPHSAIDEEELIDEKVSRRDDVIGAKSEAFGHDDSTILSADAIKNLHSIPSKNVAANATYSSHEMTKSGTAINTGTNGEAAAIPEFPETLADHPMGAQAQPTSWPDPEDVVVHIQRL